MRQVEGFLVAPVWLSLKHSIFIPCVRQPETLTPRINFHCSAPPEEQLSGPGAGWGARVGSESQGSQAFTSKGTDFFFLKKGDPSRCPSLGGSQLWSRWPACSVRLLPCFNFKTSPVWGQEAVCGRTGRGWGRTEVSPASCPAPQLQPRGPTLLPVSGKGPPLSSHPVGSSHSERHLCPPEGALWPLRAPGDIC